MKNFTKALIGLSALCAVTASIGAAQAQSFDCGPYLARRQAPETVICQSPQLQALDEEMASVYRDVMDRLPPSAANRLRQNQIGWLQSRDSCDFNANCLVSHYKRRIQVLNSY